MLELLIINMIPLYILIAMGYIGGKKLNVNTPSMASIAIFLLAPVVNFGAAAQIDFKPEYIYLPFIMFFVSAVIAFSSCKIASFIWKDSTANLVGMSMGTGNNIYFGLPIIMALFGSDIAGIYLFIILGTAISQVSVCYYIGARGNSSIKQSFMKVVKFPIVHAMLLGFLVNYLSIPLPEIFNDWYDKFTGAWIIIGMMLIGVAIAKTEDLRLDFKLLAVMFFIKFVIWPLAMIAVIFIDKIFFNLFNEQIYVMLIVLGVVPIMGNAVAFAEQLKIQSGKAAMVVLLSTIFALLFIPTIFTVMGIKI